MKATKKLFAIAATVIIASSMFATAFAATSNGTPFNELWTAIFGVQNKVEDLQASLQSLQAEVDSLQSTVESQASEIANLQAAVALLNQDNDASGLPAPDYVSDWAQIPTGQYGMYITHNLGTQDILIFALEGWNGDIDLIYGVDRWYNNGWASSGYYTEIINDNQIIVGRADGIQGLSRPIKVFIWVIPPPQ
jgi:hypothetical protein